MFIQFANLYDAAYGFLIIDSASKGIAGIGWIDDNASDINNLDSLMNQALLRIFWMDFEKLAHVALRERNPKLLLGYNTCDLST